MLMAEVVREEVSVVVTVVSKTISTNLKVALDTFIKGMSRRRTKFAKSCRNNRRF